MVTWLPASKKTNDAIITVTPVHADGDPQVLFSTSTSVSLLLDYNTEYNLTVGQASCRGVAPPASTVYLERQLRIDYTCIYNIAASTEVNTRLHMYSDSVTVLTPEDGT